MTNRDYRALPALIFVGAMLMVLMAQPAHAGTYDIQCWKASLFDLDNDGYADMHAHSDDRESVVADAAERLNCPAGYVKARGDCDDNNAKVHPRQYEMFGNGIDDNCNGLVDEPQIRYFPNGAANTSAGFTMKYYVRDQAVLNAFQSPFYSLSYMIEYQELSNTAQTFTTPVQELTNFSNYGAHSRFDVRLSGLKANTVYRARVQLYRTARFQLWDKRNKRISAIPRSYPIGDVSEWYYTSTDGETKLERERTDVVLRGLYEYFLSEHQALTGYRGINYLDGTRYGADKGELWCSEFYSWAVGTQSFTMGHRSNISSLLSFFSAHFARVFSPSQNRLEKAERGDYLALDTNDDGDTNHSAMFLAYDDALDAMWTLEGNASGVNQVGYQSRRAGNETVVRNREATQVGDLGVLRVTMF